MLATVANALGFKTVIVIPDTQSQEKKDALRLLGAELIEVPAVPYKDPNNYVKLSGRLAEQLAKTEKHGAVWANQFDNVANRLAHIETTGPEIWAQLLSIGKRPQGFVAGVGTGGTVMGVGKFLRQRDPSIRVHPVEPAESPTLTTGCKVGHHRIQGISDEFIPEIVRLKELDEVLSVPDGDAILMAQKLAFSLGLAVGISSGCNFLAAVKAQEKLGPEAVVVTIFCDDNKKYLSTALMNEEAARPEYLSPRIELLGIGTVGRACEFRH